MHHTRKQKADDAFDMISGTNCLTGVADSAFLLQKEKRTSNVATSKVFGRDQQDQRLYFLRNEEKLCWELERVETKLWEAPPEPLLEEVAKRIMPECPDWSGSPTELCEFLGVDMKANALTQKLNVNARRLFQEYSILYWNKRTHAGMQGSPFQRAFPAPRTTKRRRASQSITSSFDGSAVKSAFAYFRRK